MDISDDGSTRDLANVSVSLPTVAILTRCSLVTRFGSFQLMGIKTTGEDARHSEIMVAMKGSPAAPDWPERPLVRVHSKCETGEVFGSMQCDCSEQLDRSLQAVQAHGGLIIYLDQEGRGNGLLAKLSIYERMEMLDESSTSAAEALGFPDRRRYSEAAAILLALGVSRIRLLTNNPQKVSELQECGIDVARQDLSISPNKYNIEYLRDKLQHGHLVRLDDFSAQE